MIHAGCGNCGHDYLAHGGPDESCVRCSCSGYVLDCGTYRYFGTRRRGCCFQPLALGQVWWAAWHNALRMAGVTTPADALAAAAHMLGLRD